MIMGIHCAASSARFCQSCYTLSSFVCPSSPKPSDDGCCCLSSSRHTRSALPTFSTLTSWERSIFRPFSTQLRKFDLDIGTLASLRHRSTVTMSHHFFSRKASEAVRLSSQMKRKSSPTITRYFDGSSSGAPWDARVHSETDKGQVPLASLYPPRKE